MISQKQNYLIFLEDPKVYYQDTYETHKTKSGFVVIVEHGFDTRELLAKWESHLEVKKDAMLLLQYKVNENCEDKLVL